MATAGEPDRLRVRYQINSAYHAMSNNIFLERKTGGSRLREGFFARLDKSKSWLEYRMFKPTAIATAMLCIFTVDANAQSHHRQHYAHRARTWCGNYMSSYFGKSDRRLALAREWAREGYNAGGPGIGVVVVWRHHVGVITGQTPDGQWIIHSGNDGGAVRTRPRSLAGAIAFRRV